MTSQSYDDNNSLNDWTDKKIILLQKWKFECGLYIWLHNYNSEHYKFIDKLLAIPALVINAITTTTIFSSLNIENNRHILISIGSLLIIGTFLQSIRDFINIKKQIHNNITTSKQYQILMNDINEQLNQEPQDRTNGKDFLKKINKQRNDIVLESPFISNRSWNKLIIKIKNGNFILLENNIYFKNYFNSLNQSDKQIKNREELNINLSEDNKNVINKIDKLNVQPDYINIDIDIDGNDKYISELNNIENLTISSLKKKIAYHNQLSI